MLSSLSSEGRREALEWATQGLRDAPWATENYQQGRLYNRIRPPGIFDQQVLNAIRTHIATREYTDHNMHPRIDDQRFQSIFYEAFGSYQSSTDSGLQVWHAKNGSRHQERDASWVMVGVHGYVRI